MIAPIASITPAPVRRLPGMRDFTAAACRDMRTVQSRLSALADRYGYTQLDVPVLESTELFMRKSGGSLASQMYSFIDPGSNSVSLRPEFTSAIMRHYLELPQDSPVLPVVRWQYSGPVFRYDTNDADSSGQFTQSGAELIGSESILADAELLSLAGGVPVALGIDDYVLRLADLDVLDSVLDTAGLSDRARSFIVANMNRIGADESDFAATLSRAAELHIVSDGMLQEDQNHLANAVAGLPDQEAREVLAGFMRWNGSEVLPAGQRTTDEIVSRLLRKLKGGDDPNSVERGLKLAAQLAAVKGQPADAIARAQAIVAAAGGDPTAINRLADLIDLVVDDPSLRGHLTIDFSLARGIAYYNGIIFDIVSPHDDVNLGGGGRYDALARALGSSHNIPALGFAFTLENLLTVMSGSAASETGEATVCVAPSGPEAYRAAMQTAQNLRAAGGVAVLSVSPSASPAGESGRVVAVGADGIIE
jgi:histidyl-tRNA synthetase